MATRKTLPVCIFLITGWTFGMHERMPATEVFLNGRGPFRFAVDTGATSSTLRPRLAAAIGLTPDYRVQIVTASGQSLAPATRYVDFEVNGAHALGLELIWAELPGPARYDGVLGQNFLLRFDYLIHAGAIHIGPQAHRLAASLRAEPIPFVLSEGRMLIPARADAAPHLHLIVDSGASIPVLFQSPNAIATATVHTMNGSASAGVASLPRLRIGRQWLLDLTTAIVPPSSAPRQEDGLLPTSLFRTIFIDNQRRTITLQR